MATKTKPVNRIEKLNKEQVAPKVAAADVGMETIRLTRLSKQVIAVPIIGTTPIICHNWSEKAIRSMPGHPEKLKTQEARKDRKPLEEATNALYVFDNKADRIGMPCTAFKSAIISASRYFRGVTMVTMKDLIEILSDGNEYGRTTPLVEIVGTRTLREDTPRLPTAKGTCDLRYRFAISDWTAWIRVRFCPEIITAESIVALVDAGGNGGVGDWRPSAKKSNTGTFGCWTIDDSQEVKLG